MSFFTLTLDTTPPQAAISSRSLVQYESLSVVVTTNEPATVDAWALIPGQPPIAGVQQSGHIVFDLGGQHWPSSGTIQLDLMDAVGNATTSLFGWETPSYFTLNLDTTAPVMSIGATTINQGDSVTIDYTLNEGTVLSATAAVDGRVVTGTLQSGQIVFPIPGETWIYGRVSVDVVDSVGNAETRTFIVSTGAQQTVSRTWTPGSKPPVNDYVRAAWIIRR